MNTRPVLIAVLALTACSRSPKPATLTKFVQDSPETLAEITDSSGSAWKILSRETGAVTTLFLYNAAGKIDAVVTAAPGQTGAAKATTFLDSGEKNAALAVLNRSFLSTLHGRSSAYDAWLGNTPAFTDEKTTRVDMNPGALGSGDVTVQETRIVVRRQTPAVPCQQTGFSAACDLINCTYSAISGGENTCAAEAFKAQESAQTAPTP